MKTNDLQAELVDWSVKNSGFEAGREYIGLSGIGDCEMEIYDRLRNGQRASIDAQLKTRISYEMESALVERFKAMGLYQPGETISLHGGLVQGHTDGLIAGREILEIKTLEKAVFFPSAGVPSRRITWQVQAYMHYLKRPWCHVVYLARDTGGIFCLGVKYDPRLGERIDAKVRLLVKAVKMVQRPRCTCGHCEPPCRPAVITNEAPRITTRPQDKPRWVR
jgi:hypothetical protein